MDVSELWQVNPRSDGADRPAPAAQNLGVGLLVTVLVSKEGESLPNTRRSHQGLNDGPSLCATLYTAGSVGELY